MEDYEVAENMDVKVLIFLMNVVNYQEVGQMTGQYLESLIWMVISPKCCQMPYNIFANVLMLLVVDPNHMENLCFLHPQILIDLNHWVNYRILFVDQK